MNYCGIDIAMKSSYIYITDNKGQKKTSGEILTKASVLRQRLQPYLRGGLCQQLTILLVHSCKNVFHFSAFPIIVTSLSSCSFYFISFCCPV